VSFLYYLFVTIVVVFMTVTNWVLTISIVMVHIFFMTLLKSIQN